MFSRRNDSGSEFMADKETIITTDGGGSGAGAVLAVVGIVALLVVLFLMFGGNMLGGSAEKIDADIKVETPAK
jgi:hypothetical protein